jgi:penicillin-binding protein 1A
VLGLLGTASFTFGLVRAVASEIPNCDPAKKHNQTNGYIYAGDGKSILAVLRGDENRVIVRAEDISGWMKQAVVATEDRRFYDHRGVDIRGITRALWADIRSKRLVEGGSTITQQLVKNACAKNERTLARKVREAALAWQLEQRWGKDRILTAYLNTIYFGNGAYGVEQAARVYFGKRARDLKLPETALLAGIPADPSFYDPVAHPRNARGRRAVVLRALLEQRDITPREYKRAIVAPMPKPEDVHLPGTQGQFAPYFANYVKEQLIERYGPRTVYGGGLRVKTTIDLQLQQIARQAVAKWLPPDGEGPTAALVAIDPSSGAVLAMVGGENYHRSQFNLAVQGRRQPGSSFKPFVLATAVEDGIAPSTTFVSRPIEIPLGDRMWVVHNYEDDYMGTITLDSATTHSDNSVYAQLTRLVDPGAVARTARRLGIQSPLQSYFAIGLGAEAVNPLEMARAYAAFANGGYRIDGTELGNRPRAIEWVERKGKHKENAPAPARVLGSNEAAVVNLLLQHVVQAGTGNRAALPDRPVAGKTGTTEDYGDAWFVGYTPQLVTAVWVGYPNKLVPMLREFHGGPVAGGTYPALIWKSFMERAVKALHLEPESFDAPDNLSGSPRAVVQRGGRLLLDNGYCKQTVQLVFLAGAGPAQTAKCLPNEVEVPLVVGMTLQQAKERLAAQPLTPAFIYKPAMPGQRLGVVLGQFPRSGGLSSYDKVQLVLAKPLHGVVPKVVGLPLARAKAKLERRGLEVVLRGDSAGRVVKQTPTGGVAAAKGMVVTITVKAQRPAGAHG